MRTWIQNLLIFLFILFLAFVAYGILYALYAHMLDTQHWFNQ